MADIYNWLDAHTWAWPLFIIVARITDVSIGTVRTLMVVRGHRPTAAALGFFEVLLWISVVSGILVDVTLLKMLSYAAGFALGNLIGMRIEEKLAIGNQLTLLISRGAAHPLATTIRSDGFAVTELAARGKDGDVSVAAVVCPRRRTQRLIKLARQHDPNVFATIQDVRSTNAAALYRELAPAPTGWRSILKRK